MNVSTLTKINILQELNNKNDELKTLYIFVTFLVLLICYYR
jgi:hypothetical protein